MHEIERWKPIVGYEEIYSVSDLGNVRIEVRRHNIWPGSHIKRRKDPDGYMCVRLSIGGSQSDAKHRRVARIVAAAFIGPILEGMQINHLNGVRDDDHVSNLEIVTCQENVLGSTREGTKNPASKLTEAKILEIRERGAAGETFTALGIEFGVSTNQISMICRGKSWPHVGGPITAGKRGRPPGRRSSS